MVSWVDKRIYSLLVFDIHFYSCLNLLIWHFFKLGITMMRPLRRRKGFGTASVFPYEQGGLFVKSWFLLSSVVARTNMVGMHFSQHV